MQTKLLALVLRGSSMGSKFLLMIGLSKALTTRDYGVISLIITTLTFFIFLLGFDFYNYSHREIIENKSKQFSLLINQFWFHLFCYVLFFPVVFIIFFNDIIPYNYLISFYILLVLEHFGQEIFRFFNLFNKPNFANITLFMRTALWIIVMVLIEFLWFQNEISIKTVLNYWIYGSSICVITSFLYIFFNKKIEFTNLNFFHIEKSWIKKGLIISLPFFTGTIAYKIIEYSDRYMIDWLLGKEQVGIYSFYTNFANIVNIVVNTITITLIVPNLLRVIHLKNKMEISKMTSKFLKEIYLTTILVSILIVILIYPTLKWLNKSEFTSEVVVYFIVLMGNIFLNISLFYHFLLYAYKKDKLILKPALLAAFSNIVLNMVFIPIFGLIAAAFSTLISFLIILYLKRKYWLKFKTSIS